MSRTLAASAARRLAVACSVTFRTLIGPCASTTSPRTRSPSAGLKATRTWSLSSEFRSAPAAEPSARSTSRGCGQRPPFGQEAELALAVLALQAAVSLSSAFARERLGRLFVLEERERIAHDLHDGTIQSLYALGLSLDSAGTLAGLPQEVHDQIEFGVEQINHLISDIRAYISILGSKDTPGDPELSRDIAVAIRQLVPPAITTVFNITAAALQGLTAREAEDILYITREALSNAVRHGVPSKIAIDLRQSETETALTIQDNGVGYDQAQVRTGLGTASARNRAERLGGELTMIGIPGMGATVRVTIPRSQNA